MACTRITCINREMVQTFFRILSPFHSSLRITAGFPQYKMYVDSVDNQSSPPASASSEITMHSKGCRLGWVRHGRGGRCTELRRDTGLRETPGARSMGRRRWHGLQRSSWVIDGKEEARELIDGGGERLRIELAAVALGEYGMEGERLGEIRAEQVGLATKIDRRERCRRWPRGSAARLCGVWSNRDRCVDGTMGEGSRWLNLN